MLVLPPVVEVVQLFPFLGQNLLLIQDLLLLPLRQIVQLLGRQLAKVLTGVSGVWIGSHGVR